MSHTLCIGDTVYSRDDCSAGYGEEATVIKVVDTRNRPNPAPNWAPSHLYTIRTKSGYVVSDLTRGELSRTPLTQSPQQRVWHFTLDSNGRIAPNPDPFIP